MKTYQHQFVHGIRIDNDSNCHNQLEKEITSFIASKRRLNIDKEFAKERIMKVVIENLNGYIVKDGCITSI